MKLTSKIISILLCLVMAFSVCACNFEPGDDSGNNPPEQQTGYTLSYNYEDYIGDIETFVYGLLINKLEYLYDVFPASVQLSNSYCVYGLGYTDYSECYTNDEESVAYFKSGFLPFVGELEISQEDFDSGLYLHNLDYQDEETVFVWTYKSEAFLEHCVIYGAYLKYGVSNEGQITYEAVPFDRDKCDTSLGSLYSYDESKYLYDVDFGNYMPISGISIMEAFDYEEFEKEVNAFIEEQDANLMSYDVTTVAYSSQDAVKAYLQSLQEETFLGYSVNELIEATEELNPLECFRLTPDGLHVIDIQEAPPQGESDFVKWLVGGACAITVGAGIVASIITSACPALSSLVSAVTAAAIETFIQVVVESKKLEALSWSKVGIATISGALSGFVGPYLQALGGASYFFVDSAVDGFIGATEQAVLGWLDGANSDEIITRFGNGFALGFGISASFKLVGKALEKIAPYIAKTVHKVANKLSPKLKSGIAKFTKPIKDLGNAIGDGITKLKQKFDASVFSNNYIIKKSQNDFSENFVVNILGDSSVDEKLQEKIMKKSLRSLKSKDWFDLNGNAIPKPTIEILKNIKDGEIFAKCRIIVNGEMREVFVKKINYAADLVFPNNKYIFTINKGLSLNRKSVNFVAAAEEMINGGKSKIPQEIQDEILKKYSNYASIDDVLEFADKNELSRNIVEIVQKSSYVFHESADLITINLVERVLHDKAIGGVSHMGGIGLLKLLKQEYGVEKFTQYITAAVNGYRIDFNIIA